MYPVQIRVNSEHGPEVSFEKAVTLAMGADERVSCLSVTAVYAEGEGKYKAGDPVFGYHAELHARCTSYGENTDARVSIGGIQSHSPEVAMVRIQCYALAAQIAAAANAAAAAASA